MLQPIALVSIPKAGTHLLIKLIELLGYKRGGKVVANPKNGFWYMISDTNTHTPVEDFYNLEPYTPLVEMPILFAYRNPIDILISESFYIDKDGNTTFWSYYSNLTHEEKLLKLIDDPWLLRSIRYRLSKFIGWMEIKNVIPISYEELVGKSGGGDDAMQLQVVNSVIKKLGLYGVEAQSVCHALYDESSPTFRRGVIGQVDKVFSERCFKKFSHLNQDFMCAMGYRPLHNSDSAESYVDFYSSRINEFLLRPTLLSKSNKSETPYLIENNLYGHNVVLYRRRYYAFPHGLSVNLPDLSDQELIEFCSSDNLTSLSAELQKRELDSASYVPQLLNENFNGFNLVSYRKRLYALPHGVEVELQSLPEEELGKLHSAVYEENLRLELQGKISNKTTCKWTKVFFDWIFRFWK